MYCQQQTICGTGAVVLFPVAIFDDEASSLFHLGLAHEREKESHAFDTIGTGLFELRTQVSDLQELYLKEIGRHQENTISDQ